MKSDLLYTGFENAVSKARSLGKLEDFNQGIQVAIGHGVMDHVRIGKPHVCGYTGANKRHALIWPGIWGWICIHETSDGVLDVEISPFYIETLDRSAFDRDEYIRFFLNTMASGMAMTSVILLLDASHDDPTLLELKLRPIFDQLQPIFRVVEAQLERANEGDPALRRRVDEELAGAVGSFYNDPNASEIKVHIWNEVSQLIEEDRRFNQLTRLQSYQDMKASIVDAAGISEILAWIIDFAYTNALAIPMWDAIIAPVGVEYMPLPEASIKTVGVMSQIGKLTRDDPALPEKVLGITSTMNMDSRFDDFIHEHPGTALWQSMYNRVKRMDGEETANARLSWPLYQLLLQYAMKHGIVK